MAYGDVPPAFTSYANTARDSYLFGQYKSSSTPTLPENPSLPAVILPRRRPSRRGIFALRPILQRSRPSPPRDAHHTSSEVSHKGERVAVANRPAGLAPPTGIEPDRTAGQHSTPASASIPQHRDASPHLRPPSDTRASRDCSFKRSAVPPSIPTCHHFWPRPKVAVPSDFSPSHDSASHTSANPPRHIPRLSPSALPLLAAAGRWGCCEE